MHRRLADRRFFYGAVTVAVGLGIGVWTTAAIVGSPSELAWILAEWEAAMGHFSISLSRLVGAVLIMLGFGIPLSIASRRLPGLEATITPIMLTLLAVPWVLLAAAVNMMIHLRLEADQMVLMAAVGGGAWLVGSLAPRQQSRSERRARARYALRTIILMLIVAEMVSLSQGLGSQLRFYTLYWSPALLVLYGGLAAALVGFTIAIGRLGTPWVIKGLERFAGPHG